MGSRTAIARSLLVFATILPLAACHAPLTADVPVPTGVWGGTQASLIVTATGAHLDFPCASGDIQRPMMADSQGEFSIEGVFFQEAGPARLPQPARYIGRIQDQTMTLSVTLTSANQTLGPYTLAFGTQPAFVRCA